MIWVSSFCLNGKEAILAVLLFLLVSTFFCVVICTGSNCFELTIANAVCCGVDDCVVYWLNWATRLDRFIICNGQVSVYAVVIILLRAHDEIMRVTRLSIMFNVCFTCLDDSVFRIDKVTFGKQRNCRSKSCISRSRLAM